MYCIFFTKYSQSNSQFRDRILLYIKGQSKSGKVYVACTVPLNARKITSTSPHYMLLSMILYICLYICDVSFFISRILLNRRILYNNAGIDFQVGILIFMFRAFCFNPIRRYIIRISYIHLYILFILFILNCIWSYISPS